MPSPLLLVALSALLMVDCTLCQTFSYSRGWKSGKRAAGGVAGPAAGPAGVANGPTGHTGEDVLAEDMPLYRYFLEGRGEHRVPYDPWRLVDEPLVHFARRPFHREAALAGEQPGDHDDR